MKRAEDLRRKFTLIHKSAYCLAQLKEYTQKKRRSRRAMMMSDKYFSDLLKIKMMEALKHYVFNNRRNKKLGRYRSALKWARKTQLKTLVCLKANCQMRKEKKRKLALAFAERDRIIK